jgi:hypothetical protein
MAETKPKPSKISFVLSQGGLTGVWRGFLLAEIYAVLVAVFFTGIAFIERTNSGTELLSFGLGGLIFGQVTAVLPSAIIGLIAGLLIASGAIALKERDAGVASRLAAAVAVALSMLIDLIAGKSELGINFGYFIFVGSLH